MCLLLKTRLVPRQPVLAAISVLAFTMTVAQADDAATGVHLKRIVLVSGADAGQPVGELFYEGKYKFTTGPLSLPFHTDDAAQMALVEVELSHSNSLVDVAALELKVVDEGGKKSFFILIKPQAKNDSEMHVEIRVPIKNASDASFSEAFEAVLGETSHLNRKLGISNSMNIDWGTQKQKIELLLKRQTAVVYSDTIEPLKARSKRTLPPQKIAATVDVSKAYIDLGSLLDGTGNPKPENRTGLPRNLFIKNGASSVGERVPLPAGDVRLKWRGNLAVKSQKDVVKIQSSLPLGPATDDCAQCCCSTPADAVFNRAYLAVGEAPELLVPLSQKNSSIPWLPLSLTDAELTYLTAEPWELCLLNTGKTTQNIELFHNGNKSVAFDLSSGIEIKSGEKLALIDRVFTVSTDVMRKPRPTAEASPQVKDEWAKLLIGLNRNLVNLRGHNHAGDVKLRALLCLDPEARKAILRNELTKYLDDLAKKLMPLADAAKWYRDGAENLDQIVKAQQVLDGLTRQFTFVSDRNDSWVELHRIKMRREILERDAEKRRKELQRASAEFGWALGRPKLEVYGHPLDPVPRLQDQAKDATNLDVEVLPSLPIPNGTSAAPAVEGLPEPAR